MLEFFAGLKPCLIGTEACPAAHYWGRELQTLGHAVKLMPPSYVKAYLKRSKNDANDAAAICEAVATGKINPDSQCSRSRVDFRLDDPTFGNYRGAGQVVASLIGTARSRDRLSSPAARHPETDSTGRTQAESD